MDWAYCTIFCMVLNCFPVCQQTVATTKYTACLFVHSQMLYNPTVVCTLFMDVLLLSGCIVELFKFVYMFNFWNSLESV